MIFKIVYWSGIIFLWTTPHRVPPIPRVNWGKMVTHSILIIMGTTTVKLIEHDGTVVREIARTINVIPLQTVMPLKIGKYMPVGVATVPLRKSSLRDSCRLASGPLSFLLFDLWPWLLPLLTFSGSGTYLGLRTWETFWIIAFFFFFSRAVNIELSQKTLSAGREQVPEWKGPSVSLYGQSTGTGSYFPGWCWRLAGGPMTSASGWDLYSLDPWQKGGVCSLHLMGQALRISREARKTALLKSILSFGSMCSTWVWNPEYD